MCSGRLPGGLIIMNNENPVNAKTACVLLGFPGKPWGHSRISAIKRMMGISHQRYFFLSDMRKWLRQHPKFRQRDVYPSNPTPSGNHRGPRLETVDKLDEPTLMHAQ
jgi:hypothetical protein